MYRSYVAAAFELLTYQSLSGGFHTEVSPPPLQSGHSVYFINSSAVGHYFSLDRLKYENC